VKDQYAENGQVSPGLLGTVYWLQGVTILWMLLECSFALFAAWKARSIAPLAFGSDSLVETSPIWRSAILAKERRRWSVYGGRFTPTSSSWKRFVWLSLARGLRKQRVRWAWLSRHYRTGSRLTRRANSWPTGVGRS